MMRGIFGLLLVFMTVASTPAQHWLGAPRLLTTGGEQNRAVGDLDGDGDPDILQRVSTDARQFLNDGTGEFTPGPTFPLSAGTTLEAVVDVTGDGLLDILGWSVFSHPSGAGVIVYPGLGGGAYGPEIHTPLPAVPRILGQGDLDGDAAREVAVDYLVPSARTLAWLDWNGTSFTVVSSLIVGVTSGPTLFAVGDLNGDGVPDLVGQGNSQLFTYPTAGGLITPGPVTFLGFNNAELSTGDLEGDGDVDVVAVEFGTSAQRVTPLLNQGGLAFSIGSSILVPLAGSIFLPFSVRADLVDWDLDGDLDALINGRRAIENLGGTSFTLPDLVVGATDAAGIADCDGDGFPDIVTSNSIFFSDGRFADAQPNPVRGRGFLFDIDGDGDLDSDQTGVAVAGDVSVNDGTGRFTVMSNPLPPAPPGFVFSVTPDAVGDFDGDRRLDYLVERAIPNIINIPVDHHLITRSGPGGSLVDAGSAGTGIFSRPDGPIEVVADLDGDNDMDLYGAGVIWLNNGTGGFAAMAPGPHSNWEGRIAGDVDGDGDLDVVAESFSITGAYAVLLNGGSANFSVVPLNAGNPGTSQRNRPALVDLDDDGDLDVALDETTTGTQFDVEVWRNDGGGSFFFAWAAQVPNAVAASTVRGADVDGDGLTDLLIGSQGFLQGSALYVWRRNGPGFSYDPPRAWAAGQLYEVADVDQDGDPDLLSDEGVVFNRRFRGLAAGAALQFGVGFPGSGGFTPVLAGLGPFRPNRSPALRISQGAGGVMGVLAVAPLPSNTPGPLPGMSLYAVPWTNLAPIALQGTAAFPATGSLTLPLGLMPPGVAGLQAVVQAALLDPGATGGVSLTNGLFVLFGL